MVGSASTNAVANLPHARAERRDMEERLAIFTECKQSRN
jgi:hypothetical protein